MLSPGNREVFENCEISALYLNDGSVAPLWKIHWYALEVEVASDGKHFVRLNTWASFDEQGAESSLNKFKNLPDLPPGQPLAIK